MVKSEAQTCCDSSELGDDSKFVLRYSTYHSHPFQVPMTSEGLRTNVRRTTRSSGRLKNRRN